MARPRTKPLTYVTVHREMRRLRGSARLQRCQVCGGPARDWAYDHTDPGEKIDPEKGYLFSESPDRYVALCRSCHLSLDTDAGQQHVFALMLNVPCKTCHAAPGEFCKARESGFVYRIVWMQHTPHHRGCGLDNLFEELKATGVTRSLRCSTAHAA